MLPFLGGKESGGPVHTWWCKACFVPTALGSSLPPGETEESRGREVGKGFALKQPQQQCPNLLPTTQAQVPSLVHSKMRSGWARCCLVGKSPHSSRLWMQTRSEELLIKPRLAEECKTQEGGDGPQVEEHGAVGFSWSWLLAAALPCLHEALCLPPQLERAQLAQCSWCLPRLGSIYSRALAEPLPVQLAAGLAQDLCTLPRW